MAEIRVQVYANWLCARCSTIVYWPASTQVDDRVFHSRRVLQSDGIVRDDSCVARSSEGVWLDKIYASIVH